ncbi:hypothetical protein B5X24_HaOG204584 [Helicoverpa armigera]|nr:hypothetical protein B5X24_HaOG204584 [Helicoverpa armigera]
MELNTLYILWQLICQFSTIYFLWRRLLKNVGRASIGMEDANVVKDQRYFASLIPEQLHICWLLTERETRTGEQKRLLKPLDVSQLKIIPRLWRHIDIT